MGTPRVVVGCVRSCDARLHRGDHRRRVADAMSTACSPSRSQARRPLYVFLFLFFFLGFLALFYGPQLLSSPQTFTCGRLRAWSQRWG